VADTAGALFPKELYLPPDNKYIISKGVKREFDAYSGFQDTPLLALLQERGIRRVFVGGLATEYCVKNTVEGALNLGFTTIVLEDAIRGIELTPGDCGKVLEGLLASGAIAMMPQDLY
ncbi:MAG: Nicotinamidase, partial [Firmicutes bacterium]|nr:Nicotinamidase [Bacillota bacterium]